MVHNIENTDPSIISNNKSNKSPGPDGLTWNFYKIFWKDLKMLLFNALIESIVD